MTRLAFTVAAVLSACTSSAGGPVTAPRLQQSSEPQALFAATVTYLAERAEERLQADPRPLRRSADLARVQDEDLADDADSVARSRAEVLAARGIAVTNAAADSRCTFPVGVGFPPEREAALPDSVRQQTRECRERPPYTTLIVGLPGPAAGQHAAGTVRVEAVAMTRSGFQIWDLYLRPAADGSWRVTDARTRLNIRS